MILYVGLKALMGLYKGSPPVSVKPSFIISFISFPLLATSSQRGGVKLLSGAHSFFAWAQAGISLYKNTYWESDFLYLTLLWYGRVVLPNEHAIQVHKCVITLIKWIRIENILKDKATLLYTSEW